MSHFARTVYDLEKRYQAEEHAQRQLVNLIFDEHRNRLTSIYCRLMRLHDEVERCNQALACTDFAVPNAMPSRDWCNAAVLILCTADEGVQRYFLLSDWKTNNKCVQAVLDDQGIERPDGFWVDLPV